VTTQRNYFGPKPGRCQASSQPIEALLSIGQAAEILQISKRSLYRHVEERAIPHLRIGGLIRFRPRDLDRWLDDRCACVEHG
jgi:excisionase family DNA binding protein